MTQKSTTQNSPIIVQLPGASYSIRIEEGLLDRIAEALGPLIANRKVFLLSDTNVWKFWGEKLARSLRQCRPPVMLISPGERYKRLVTVEKITDMLAEHGERKFPGKADIVFR